MDKHPTCGWGCFLVCLFVGGGGGSVLQRVTCVLIVCRNVRLSDSIHHCCRSKDGRILVVSSMDGYCSVVTFDAGELGVPYTPRPASSVSMDTHRSSGPRVIKSYGFIPRHASLQPLGTVNMHYLMLNFLCTVISELLFLPKM